MSRISNPLGDGAGGLSRLPASGTINVSNPNLSLNADGITIDAEFEVSGPTGMSGIALELYFNKEGELSDTRGTINSTTVGVLVGNTVTELTVGQRPSVNWAAVDDGIVTGDNPKVNARVFIP